MKEIEILVHNILNLALLIFHQNKASVYFIHNQNICSNKHFSEYYTSAQLDQQQKHSTSLIDSFSNPMGESGEVIYT